jgi:hypothetical protein
MKHPVCTSAARLALACILLAGLVPCASAAQARNSAQLDKHARKVHHRLAKFHSGSYLHLVLRDEISSYGALGTLSDASFTFTNADSNATATYSYDDIARVRTDRETIGNGSEPRHHIRHLVPILVTAAAVGAGVAVYEVER